MMPSQRYRQNQTTSLLEQFMKQLCRSSMKSVEDESSVEDELTVHSSSLFTCFHNLRKLIKTLNESATMVNSFQFWVSVCPTLLNAEKLVYLQHALKELRRVFHNWVSNILKPSSASPIDFIVLI